MQAQNRGTQDIKEIEIMKIKQKSANAQEIKSRIKSEEANFQTRLQNVDPSKTKVTKDGLAEISVYYNKDGKMLYSKAEIPNSEGAAFYTVPNDDGGISRYQDVDKDGNMDIMTYYEKGQKYGSFEAIDQNDDGEFDIGIPLKNGLYQAEKKDGKFTTKHFDLNT